VRLLLKQHVGAPAVACVRKGDRVARGQLVADIPAGALGARLHASIAGVVSFVDDRSIRIERAP
jgi:Na+-translocating ferredoxin:NAD+ oxidoreductase RnfC subunit